MNDTLLLSDEELSGAFASCSREAVEEFHERRASNRWSYPAVQPVAPYGHWGFPKAGMFENVLCFDLSTGGISFILAVRPKFEFAVIGLGPAEQRKWFVIQVIYCRELTPGTSKVLVGCQFLERIRPPAQDH